MGRGLAPLAAVTRRSPNVLFLRTRRVIVPITAAVVVQAVTGGIGFRELPIGVRDGIPQGAPLWAYLPIVTAALIVLSTTGDFESIDGHAVRPMALWTAGLVLGLIGVTVVLVIAVSLVIGAIGAGDNDVAGGLLFGLGSARNIVGWSGTCLVASRLLGARLAFVPAIGLLFVFEWFGRGALGMPASWAFAIAPVASSRSWLVAGACCLLGLVAVLVDEWRLATLRKAIGRASVVVLGRDRHRSR